MLLALLWIGAVPTLRYDLQRDGDVLKVALQIDAEVWGREARWLCVPIDGAGAAINALRVDQRPIPPEPTDGDCFGPLPRTPMRVSYEVSLIALAARRGDPDYALNDRDTHAWISNDRAFLLRPDAYAGETEAVIRVKGSSFSAVWHQEGARSDTLSADQLHGGAYVLFAPPRVFRALPPLAFGDKQARIVRFRPSAGPSDAVLRSWVNNGASALVDFHGALPTPMHVILVPVPGVDRAGVFGTVQRRADASVVLFFGENALAEDFTTDWMSVHELFHPGIPHIAERPGWFIEGFTTYYQDILRARRGMISSKDAWDDLADGNQRFCAPAGGRSLRRESASLRHSHAYQRVYWGGACVAALLDFYLREHGSSLDQLMRTLFKRSLEAPLSEAALLCALDAETAGLASRLVDETRAMPLAGWGSQVQRYGMAITSAK